MAAVKSVSVAKTMVGFTNATEAKLVRFGLVLRLLIKLVKVVEQGDSTV